MNDQPISRVKELFSTFNPNDFKLSFVTAMVGEAEKIDIISSIPAGERDKFIEAIHYLKIYSSTGGNTMFAQQHLEAMKRIIQPLRDLPIQPQNTNTTSFNIHGHVGSIQSGQGNIAAVQQEVSPNIAIQNRASNKTGALAFVKRAKTWIVALTGLAVATGVAITKFGALAHHFSSTTQISK